MDCAKQHIAGKYRCTTDRVFEIIHFCERSHLTVQDVVMFTKTLTGIVEVDESLFGRKVKYNEGNPHKGLRVWVFGMVEKSTNSLILYPVHDRRAKTLLPLIQQHVLPGSTIFSDGWSAYCPLNEMGYRHFTVLHKYTFKKVYVNKQTKETMAVDTNRIEGAWKHAKDYFRRMSGTTASQWESHMAEVMWRSVVKGDVYSFFDFLKTVFPLDQPPQYTYSTPLFDSWTGPINEDTLEPAFSDANSETDVDTDDVDTGDERHQQANSQTEDGAGDATLIADNDADRTINYSELNTSTYTIPCKTKIDNVCAPSGFMQVKEDRKKLKLKKKPATSPSYSLQKTKQTRLKVLDCSSDDEDFLKPVKALTKKSKP